MGIDRPAEPPDAENEGGEQTSARDSSQPADSRVPSEGASETRSRQECYEALVSGSSTEPESFGSILAADPASERFEWQTPLQRGDIDQHGRGVIDERAKKFSPAERRIAEYLADSGPAVVAVCEGYGVYGRTPDARVNGIPVEFKSLDAGASDRTVKAALNSAKGQARHAVIDARSSGLAEDDAHHGLRRFSGTPHGNRLDAVLIIGDNYSIDWKRAG